MLKTSAGCCYERVRMGPHRGRPPSIKKFTCAQFSAIPFALSALTGTIEGNHTICKGLLNEVVPEHDQKIIKTERFRYDFVMVLDGINFRQSPVIGKSRGPSNAS